MSLTEKDHTRSKRKCARTWTTRDTKQQHGRKKQKVDRFLVTKRYI